ncbi:MAG TPA: hypothetical protein VGM56_13955 [Byssovorax sp.]|jgi:hypothetical protein
MGSSRREAAPRDALVHVQVAPPPMPRAVRGALTALALAALFGALPCVLGEMHGADVPIGLYLLLVTTIALLVGVAAAERLAFRAGRPLAVAAALYAALVGRRALEVAGAPPDASAIAAVCAELSCAMLIAAAISLSNAAARRWFRLTCPSCEAPASGAPDLLRRGARCDRCGLRW